MRIRLAVDGVFLAEIRFDALTGTVIIGPDGTTVRQLLSGWWEVGGAFIVAGSNVSVGFWVYDETGAKFAGDGVSGIYVSSPQLEIGAFPTSCIPTADSQVTRVADLLSIPNGPWRSPAGRLEVDTDSELIVTLGQEGIATSGSGHLRSIKFIPEPV